MDGRRNPSSSALDDVLRLVILAAAGYAAYRFSKDGRIPGLSTRATNSDIGYVPSGSGARSPAASSPASASSGAPTLYPTTLSTPRGEPLYYDPSTGRLSGLGADRIAESPQAVYRVMKDGMLEDVLTGNIYPPYSFQRQLDWQE